MKIGLAWVVFLLFLVLKLAGVIAWSWWWVTSPLWIVVLIVTILYALAGFVTVKAVA